MLMYGWMTFVELAPGRYDWAVRVMTGGRVDRIKDRISAYVRRGDRVLDVGCGTGTLALRCLARGASVVGLDISDHMLANARQRADRAGFGSRLTLVRDSVTQLGRHFEDRTFDVITCTLVLGEFPREYLEQILGACGRMLAPGGRLLIADEVWPESRVGRALARCALAVLWIPQFLLLRRVTYPVSNITEIVRRCGLHVERVESWPGSTLRLLSAVRPELAR